MGRQYRTVEGPRGSAGDLLGAQQGGRSWFLLGFSRGRGQRRGTDRCSALARHRTTAIADSGAGVTLERLEWPTCERGRAVRHPGVTPTVAALVVTAARCCPL